MPVKGNSRRFIVRGGTKNGQYITVRTRQARDAVVPKKYAWAKTKVLAVKLTYEQARGVTRRYGGEIVCVA